MYFFNYKIGLLFNGEKYQEEVIEYISISRGDDGIEHRTITLAYQNKDSEAMEITVVKKDYDLFFNLKKGHTTAIYVSPSQSDVFYVPALYKGISLFVFLSFVFFPLIFAVFGQTYS